MNTQGAYSRVAIITVAVLVVCIQSVTGQTVSKNDRESARLMLHNVRDAIKKDYYDPTFHGVNIDEQFKAAEERMKTATSNGQLFGIIAQAMLSLNDTHTFFQPPQRATRIDYGWRTKMVGDKCYITAIKPGTDAEAKGLKPGDILHVVDGYKVTLENFWLLEYLYNALQPRASLRVVVQGPDEQPRQVDFNAIMRPGKKILDLASETGLDFNDFLREGEEEDEINQHRYYEFGKELFVWKMPHFDLSKDQVDEMMDKVRKYKALIIDLRENGGGLEETLLRLIGNLFESEVKVGDIKRRSETKPLVAKSRGRDIYQGQVILLVDNLSGSASELLARVVQLEKRGTVIGDHTAGAVMRARGRGFALGSDSMVFYGASITDADIVMTDGASLEHKGVSPDKLMLPSGADQRKQLDPVLSYAASLAGVQIDPGKAGSMFPVRWKTTP